MVVRRREQSIEHRALNLEAINAAMTLEPESPDEEHVIREVADVMRAVQREVLLNAHADELVENHHERAVQDEPSSGGRRGHRRYERNQELSIAWPRSASTSRARGT